jgi:hypothetical protein
MHEQALEDRNGRPLSIDLCRPCQVFWFDTHESPSLTPGSTLALFRLIGEQVTRTEAPAADTPACPRCRARLRRVHDMQRTTRFEYLKCPRDHGRLTTFFNFLREKDFIRPLTPAQIAELRQHVQTVNCSNCGGAVDLARGTSCAYCRSPVSMLDLKQAEQLVAQLQNAERARDTVDPSLPLDLARARRETEATFAMLEQDPAWWREVSADGLVGAGLRTLARWMTAKG